jgi:SAM-dependent methyltransferase
VVFEEGEAEHLPYPDEAFDLVTSRIAMHHFPDPLGPAREMARVCRPGGHVAIIDITSSDNAEVAAAHNRLERLRDPSHARSMHIAELRQMAEATGLDTVRTSVADVEVHVETWMDLTDTPQDARVTIRQAMEADLAGGAPTGMRPSCKDGELVFSHAWVILVGRKP